MTLHGLNFRLIQPIFLSAILVLSSLAPVSAEEKTLSPSTISPPMNGSVSASSKESFLLDQFLQEVMQGNPNLQSAQFQAEAMQYKIKPAGSLEDPVIGIGPDDIPLNGAEGNVIRYQINQIIPFPGKPITRSKIAKAKAEASSSDVETTRRQLVLFATQIFYKTYLNQESIRLNDETQKLIKALIDTSKSRYETGGGSHHEWLLSKAELGVFETEKLKLLREQKALKALLNELRSQEPSTAIEVLKPKFTKVNALQVPQAASLETQPERKALGKLAEAAKLEKDLAKMGYAPDFMLQSMFTQRQGMEEPSTWGLMVGLNVPIFAYRKQANLVQVAEREKRVALSEQKSIENKLKTEIVEAEQQFQTALDIVKLYGSTVTPQTRLALQSAQANYATGNIPASSILNLARVRLTQELELLAAKVDLEIAQVRIKELLSSPPIQRFAPSSPSLFFAEPMGGGMKNNGMSGSAAGMGRGMSGPAAQPQRMDQQNTQGSGSSTGMGGMR